MTNNKKYNLMVNGAEVLTANNNEELYTEAYRLLKSGEVRPDEIQMDVFDGNIHMDTFYFS